MSGPISKINLGGVEVELLQDGTFWLDGGAMFGVTPRNIWEALCPPDEKNRIELALNSLLVRYEGKNILVEGGIGAGHQGKFCQIFRIEQKETLLDQLAEKNLTPGDIDEVIFTHLHFDHSGWLSRREEERFKLTFPKARIWVQRDHLQEAFNPHRTVAASFIEERLAPLKNSPLVRPIDGRVEIDDFIEAIPTPGHTEGHQSILIKGKERQVCFTGDLIPTVSHISSFHIMAYDRFPEENFQNKVALMKEASDNHWFLVFPHEVKNNFVSLRPSKEHQYCFVEADH